MDAVSSTMDEKEGSMKYKSISHINFFKLMIFFTILDQLEILDSIKNISDIMRCNQTMNT